MRKEKPSPKAPVEKPGKQESAAPAAEKGGFKDKNLPEPTRYGDWEVGGRCSDF
jgi:hypothetical protein